MKKSDFRNINLSDKDAICNIFRDYPPVISEYTFSNLFIWRKSRKTKTLIRDDGAFFLMSFNDKDFLMPPAGFKDRLKAWEELLDLYYNDNTIYGITRIPEEDLSFIEVTRFKPEEDRDHFDYIYRKEDLATLKGRKYDGKRWLIKKFTTSVKYEYSTYNSAIHLKGCISLEEEWKKKKSTENPNLIHDYDAEAEAITEYLNHLADFNCCGMVIIYEDKIIAFSFGERLNSNTFVIHFEKADPSYPGIYQTTSHLFAKNFVRDTPFINREQDMGIEGLRKAKLSWHPCGFVKKFKIIKNDY